jgi:hypothetical protein
VNNEESKEDNHKTTTTTGILLINNKNSKQLFKQQSLNDSNNNNKQKIKLRPIKQSFSAIDFNKIINRNSINIPIENVSNNIIIMDAANSSPK